MKSRTAPKGRLAGPPKLALISMPWMAAALPSIQLATVAKSLEEHDIQSDCHELYLDFASAIGLHLYALLSNHSGFIEEWLFAQHYFRHHPDGKRLAQFRKHRPRLGLQDLQLEEDTLDALLVMVDEFIATQARNEVWSQYDIVGFSLTISQTASSMAFARALKAQHPDLTVVFGGTGCAEPMGTAILNVCPEVDIVVTAEGETVFPNLVACVRSRQSIADLKGIVWRDSEARIVSNGKGPLFTGMNKRTPLSYDQYFERLRGLEMGDELEVWLPFEGSRGCWYGQKVQCTFCGLHDIMTFREREARLVLEELKEWNTRYGISNFFSVDLILPRRFFDELLPELRGREWSIFYEVKANMDRTQVESLSRAGIEWIQPGIESLDDELLRLLRKGVSAQQNVQILKHCEEEGIRVTWNLLHGIPGETEECYARMIALLPKLFHLPPPLGPNAIQLHRFSPYFESPGTFGLSEDHHAHQLYRYVFPVEETILDDLVYLHSFDERNGEPGYIEELRTHLQEWYRARRRNATLQLFGDPGDACVIVDTRGEDPYEYPLTREERLLYDQLDESIVVDRLASEFPLRYPSESRSLGGEKGIRNLVDQWIDAGLVLQNGKRVLALALRNRSTQKELSRGTPFLTQAL